MAYQGITARLPIGLQGFSGSRNPSQMQPGHLVACEGLSLEGGIIQKEGGAEQLNTAALGAPSAVVSGVNWSPISGTDRDVVFLANGSVLKDDGTGAFATTMASGLNSVREPPPVFAVGGGETVGEPRTLFLFSSVNQVMAADADAATITTIANPATDWTGAGNFPKFGLLHAARMWAGGNASDPHRIYASPISDHKEFVTGVLTFPIYPGEGSGIAGAISFRGVLVLFKFPRGVYILDTRDPDDTNWSVSKLSGAVGAVNHNSIVQIENEIMYMDEAGNVHLLSATNDFGDINTSNISQIADLRPYIKANVNRSQIKRAVGLWYPAKRQAWFGLPSVGSGDNPIRLAVDFNRPDVGPRFIPTQRDENIAMWMRQEADGAKPATGDSGGFVWLMDREARNKEGVSYPLRLETSNTDLSFIEAALGAVLKTGQFLELVSEPQGNWDLTVEIYWDDVLTDTVLFEMGTEGAALGTFQLDVNALTSAVVSSNRKRIAGSGRRLKLIIYNTGNDQNVAVADFLLSFAVGDEKDKSSRGTEAT